MTAATDHGDRAGLIDWSLAFAVAGELSRQSDRLPGVVEQALAAAPVFGNKQFPLSPLPLFLDPVAAADLVPLLEGYVGVLEKVVRLYREDPDVRHWYGLGQAAQALIDAEPAGGREIRVCRIDGYLEQGTERLRILENNADSPAGTLFTARIHDVVQSLLERAGIRVPGHLDQLRPRPEALLDVLRAAVAASGGRTGSGLRVAVLQPAGRANRESTQMAEYFSTLGVEAIVADPRELSVSAGHATVGGKVVDVCWNKVNTVVWDRLLGTDSGLLAQWIRLLRETDLVHVNSFGARYVAESKLSLAFLHDPQYAAAFTEPERELIDRLVPFSGRVDTDPALARRLLAEQQRFVLKEPYDIRGDGVLVGRAATPAEWVAAVAKAAHEPRIAQEYVAPTAYPVLRVGQNPGVVAMPLSTDTYVFDGKAACFGSKASLNARVNVFQGGQKLAVHVAEPEEGTGGS